MGSIEIIGAGRHIPPHAVHSNELAEFAGFPGGWDGKRITEKTGIVYRRFNAKLDIDEGMPVATKGVRGEVEMAANAARIALESAGSKPDAVDLLIFVSCTAPHGEFAHFGDAAQLLHHQLGLRPDTKLHLSDAGCGGAVEAMEVAVQRLRGSEMKKALIVASNHPSMYMHRNLYLETNAWLSSMIFGDGAAAVVLEKTERTDRGIIAAFTEVHPEHTLISMVPGEAGWAYNIHGYEVATGYSRLMKPVLNRLFRSIERTAVDHFLLHQVNERILDRFIDDYGLESGRVPKHISGRGNIAAAATLDLFAGLWEAGKVTKETLIVFAAIGAGAQAGALAVRM